MRKTIIIVFLTTLTFSCTKINGNDNVLAKMETLKRENDSLKKIVAEINEKYVFDSLTVRDIPYENNTFKLNSIYRTKIVFVGYNKDGKSSMVIGDSILYNDGGKIINGDSLELKKGEFLLEKKLSSKLNYFRGNLKTENKYGKPYEVYWTTAIKAD